jgi:FkbM family methyltransferase
MDKVTMHRNDFFNQLQDQIVRLVFQELEDMKSNVSFIQVGANDGSSADPIFEFATRSKWTGYAIEPVPFVYEKLKKSYNKYPNVTPLNFAVGKQTRICKFYSVNMESQIFPSMLASFDRKTIIKHENLIPDIEKYIREIDVNCYTLDDICSSQNIKDLDVLIVDTEGTDDEVIFSLSLNHVKPIVIIYEHRHISASHLLKLHQNLLSFGYQRLTMWADTMYVLPELMNEKILKVSSALPILFSGPRDPVWGNGDWLLEVA